MWNWQKLKGQQLKVWTRSGQFYAGTLAQVSPGMIALVELPVIYEILTAAVEVVQRVEATEGKA